MKKNNVFASASIMMLIVLFSCSKIQDQQPSPSSLFPSETVGNNAKGAGDVNNLTDQQILVTLYGSTDEGLSFSVLDAVRLRYNTGYCACTNDDIIKMQNPGENISSYRAGQDLIVEKRPLITGYDTTFIHLWNLRGMQVIRYKMVFESINWSNATVAGFIDDAYTTRSYNCNPTAGSPVTLLFETNDNIPRSYSIDRFRLRFSPIGIGHFP